MNLAIDVGSIFVAVAIVAWLFAIAFSAGWK